METQKYYLPPGLQGTCSTPLYYEIEGEDLTLLFRSEEFQLYLHFVRFYFYFFIIFCVFYLGAFCILKEMRLPEKISVRSLYSGYLLLQNLHCRNSSRFG